MVATRVSCLEIETGQVQVYHIQHERVSGRTYRPNRLVPDEGDRGRLTSRVFEFVLVCGLVFELRDDNSPINRDKHNSSSYTKRKGKDPRKLDDDRLVLARPEQ